MLRSLQQYATLYITASFQSSVSGFFFFFSVSCPLLVKQMPESGQLTTLIWVQEILKRKLTESASG